MRKSRFTEPQIMAVLRQAESGVAVPDLCREHGISIALACRTFGVSETCFRYSPKRDSENEFIADLPEGLAKALLLSLGRLYITARELPGGRSLHPVKTGRITQGSGSSST